MPLSVSGDFQSETPCLQDLGVCHSVSQKTNAGGGGLASSALQTHDQARSGKEPGTSMGKPKQAWPLDVPLVCF